MNVDRFLDLLLCLDAALISYNRDGEEPVWPEMSPWWAAQLERFFRSGRRNFVLRVGRRGGKSSTMCRVAVAWALWGDYAVPAGDIGVIAIVSISRDESAQRLRTIAAILDAIQVPYRTVGPSIELLDRRVMFKTFTASIAGVSGFTAIMVLGDEVAKWKDADSGKNPAREVVASIRPTVLTQPHAPLFWVSSAFSKDDHHAHMFDQGETEAQLVASAPTWEANPSDKTTEEETRKLEPDVEVWRREYGSIPSASVTGNWFGDALDAAVEDVMPMPAVYVRPLFAIDPAFAGGESSPDLFGWAAVTSELSGSTRITRVRACNAWKPDRPPSEMATRVRKEVCDVYDPKHATEPRVTVYSDQHEGHSFAELARGAGLNVIVEPWIGGKGENSKVSRFKSVRTAMLQGTFKIPNDPDLLRELRAVSYVLTDGGTERIEVTRSAAGHGDRVSAMILAGSLALERSATLVDKPPQKSEQQTMREAAELAVIKKRKEEMRRDPMAALRRAR